MTDELQSNHLLTMSKRQQKLAKLEMKPDFSPMKKKKKVWGNILDVYATAVPVLFIAIPTRSDKDEAPWMKPIVDAWNEDEDGQIAKKLNVLAIMELKGNNGNTPKPKAPDSSVGWESYIIYKDDDEDNAKSLGKKLATALTELVEQLDAYERKIPYIFGQCHVSHAKSLNHFLLDKDVIALLKRMYPSTSKPNLMKDDDAMKTFFGTVSEGVKVLGELSEHAWDRVD